MKKKINDIWEKKNYISRHDFEFATFKHFQIIYVQKIAFYKPHTRLKWQNDKKKTFRLYDESLLFEIRKSIAKIYKMKRVFFLFFWFWFGYIKIIHIFFLCEKSYIYLK